MLSAPSSLSSKAVVSPLGRRPTGVNEPQFINRLFEEGGLGKRLNMFLIWLVLILPLRSVAPLAALYWLRRLLGGRPPQLRLHGSFAAVAASWFRGYLAVEVAFFFYHSFTRFRLSSRRARPPMLKPGQPLEVCRRCLAAVEDIQNGGAMGRMHMTSRPKSPCLTPSASMQDLMGVQELPEPMNLERLLRRWDSADLEQMRKKASRRDGQETVLSPAPRKGQKPTRQGSQEFEWDKMDQAQLLALKWAEMSGWFLGSKPGDIRRGNVEEWSAWAFFDAASTKELSPERQKELGTLVTEIEAWAELTLPEGYNPDVKSMRLTVDPVPTLHRPLVYYAVTGFAMPLIQEVLLHRLGFQSHKSGTMSYWLRLGAHRCGSPTARPQKSGPPPLVFCHGIGVSVMPYLRLIQDLLHWGPGSENRDIFLLSMPNIAMRIQENAPSMAETVACISDMLDSWDVSTAHFVGHSFGSCVLSWMVRRAPKRVLALTFIDPVVFLLAKPDVSYNFMYKEPESPTQLLLHYFVSKEMYISHSLARNFFWTQCILWPEQIEVPTLVVLSSNDSIVPTHSVRRYLAAHIQKDPNSDIRVLYFPDLGHGEINFGPRGAEATGRILNAMWSMEERLEETAPAS